MPTTRNERLQLIHEQFDRSVQQFCDESDGLSYEIFSQYKGAECAEHLTHRMGQIYYNTFLLEFRYTARGVMGVTNSLLEGYVYPAKSADSVAIPLPLFLDYCDVDTVIPLCIPMITSAQGMHQAFDCLGSVFKAHLNTISAHCMDVQEKNRVLQAFYTEINFVLDLGLSEKDTHIPLEEKIQFYITPALYHFFTTRLSTSPFINFLKGNREVAIQQLSKIKKPMGYEARMVRLWQSEKQPPLPDLSCIVQNTEAYNKHGVQKGNVKEFIAIFLAWVFLTVGISLVYIGIYFLLMYLEGRHSVYLMGPIYSSLFSIIFAFITAIAASYFTRFALYRLLFPKDYERYYELDQIQNGIGSDKLMKGFLIILVVCSLAGCVLLTKWNINFKQDGFVDNTAFFSVSGEYHSYDEVDRIYYKPDRINGFGDTLDYPSYVLVLRDGTEIDFYEYDEIEIYEQTLLNFLLEKGIPIEKP